MRDWEQPQASGPVTQSPPCSHHPGFTAVPSPSCSDALQSLCHLLCSYPALQLAWLPLLSQCPWASMCRSVTVCGVSKKLINAWQTCPWRSEIPRKRAVGVEWSRSPCTQEALSPSKAAGLSAAGGRDPQFLFFQPRPDPFPVALNDCCHQSHSPDCGHHNLPFPPQHLIPEHARREGLIGPTWRVSPSEERDLKKFLECYM